MKDNKQKLGAKEIFLMVFESVMAVFYLFLSYLLAFTAVFGHLMDYPIRLGLGIILALYGIFRIYRAIEKILIIRQHKG